jgi:hypothetical protein
MPVVTTYHQTFEGDIDETQTTSGGHCRTAALGFREHRDGTTRARTKQDRCCGISESRTSRLRTAKHACAGQSKTDNVRWTGSTSQGHLRRSAAS